MTDTSKPDDRITTIIFDVDDTLYDVGTGFTHHRNGEAAPQFMVEYLGFPDYASAKKVRDVYFERYHATAKALTVAEQEGAFPPADDNNSDPSSKPPSKSPRFDPNDLDEYWATSLNYSILGAKKTQLLQDLKECHHLNLVAFSNGPRKYVKRVLEELGLWEVFGEDGLFAVTDTLPFCKPEREAFEKVFEAFGVVKPEECVMVEDSMKNIRRAKELGLKTVLVTGAGRLCKNNNDPSSERSSATQSAADAAEATKPGDAPLIDDPAVDVVIETVDELRSALPGLWDTPAVFAPASKIYYPN